MKLTSLSIICSGCIDNVHRMALQELGLVVDQRIEPNEYTEMLLLRKMA